MEPEGSLQHSQVSTTCPYPEPARSSPCPHIPLPKIHLNIILSSKSHVPFPLLGSYQIISPGPRLSVWMFRNVIRFYGDELSVRRPTPKLEDHPVSAVRDCLFNLFAATLHFRGRSSISSLRKLHSVVTKTHLSRIHIHICVCVYICIHTYGVRGGAVEWRATLQAGTSRVRFPIWSFGFFINLIIPSAIWPLSLTQPLTEKSKKDVFWGKGGRCLGLIPLPPSCADCLELPGASTSLSSEVLPRPV